VPLPARRLPALLAVSVSLTTGLTAGLLATAVTSGAGAPPDEASAPGRPTGVAVPRPAAARVHAALPDALPAAAPGPVPRPAAASGPRWPALEAAIGRIPGYADAQPATWLVSGRYGHYGSTELSDQTITIAPTVPTRLLDSVVRHEWSHILQARAYGGDVPAMLGSLNAAFGGPGGRGVSGVERAADCMARQLGATWTHYTSCDDPDWQARAATLRAGRRL